MYSHKLSKYIKSKQIVSKNNISVNPRKKQYDFFIVIPAYAENNYIDDTLTSITSQNKLLLHKTLIVIVINNSNLCNQDIKHNNYNTYKKLINTKYIFEAVVIDCFSDKYCFKHNIAGVGMARKVGLDFCLSYAHRNSLLCSLDADTLVHPKYLLNINNEFQKKLFSAAVVDFQHQESSNNQLNKAIKEYELILKNIAHQIRLTGSPYGYVSMGSTMVCTTKAYISIGGMSPKQATEDFYFLQELAKFNSVYFIEQILVFPSPRSEQRVYLGTGFRMKNYTETQSFNDLYYANQAYQSLANIYQYIQNFWNHTHKEFFKNKLTNDGKLEEYLNDLNFNHKIKMLKNTSLNKKQFINQFHKWFDNLKIYKLLKLYGK